MGAGTLQAAAAGTVPAPPSLDFQKLLGRDEVTGLPNRQAFEHVLGQQAALAERLQTRLGLLVIHCDSYAGFAAVHEISARERHLLALTRRLRGCCRRAYDVLGFLQPGQFAAMLPFTDAAGADAVARNMAHGLAEPEVEPAVAEAARLGYVPLLPDGEAAIARGVALADADGLGRSALSIGIAVYCGKGPLSAARILAAAEEACRIVQAGGGGRALRRDTALAP